MLQYKKGQETKSVVVTKHSIIQFRKRYWRIYRRLGHIGSINYNKVIFNTENLLLMDKPVNENIEIVLGKLFNISKKIELGKTKKEKRRNFKYGGYLRFRYGPFDFIIDNGGLVTVEITDSEFRNLNYDLTDSVRFIRGLK